MSQDGSDSHASGAPRLPSVKRVPAQQLIQRQQQQQNVLVLNIQYEDCRWRLETPFVGPLPNPVKVSTELRLSTRTTTTSTAAAAKKTATRPSGDVEMNDDTNRAAKSEVKNSTTTTDEQGDDENDDENNNSNKDETATAAQLLHHLSGISPKRTSLAGGSPLRMPPPPPHRLFKRPSMVPDRGVSRKFPRHGRPLPFSIRPANGTKSAAPPPRKLQFA
jgi:hypothetical protein